MKAISRLRKHLKVFNIKMKLESFSFGRSASFIYDGSHSYGGVRLAGNPKVEEAAQARQQMIEKLPPGLIEKVAEEEGKIHGLKDFFS